MICGGRSPSWAASSLMMIGGLMWMIFSSEPAFLLACGSARGHGGGRGVGGLRLGRRGGGCSGAAPGVADGDRLRLQR